MTPTVDAPGRRGAALDAALAVGLWAVGGYELLVEPLAEDVIGGPLWLDLLALSAGTLPLAWRRRAPFWVSLLVFGSMGARSLVGDPLELYPPAIAALVAAYTVASYAPLRDAVLAAGFATLSISLAVVNGSGTDAAPDPLASAILYGSVWLVGRVVGVRQERARQLHEARDQHAAEAVADERARIARELHDAVSHSLAAIVVQSAGAQNIIDSDPERARASLSSIEAAGRRGLEEMRRLLGLLADPDTEHDDGTGTGPALAPQPGLDRLGDLVDSLGGTGLQVELTVTGRRRPLPSSVDVSAYRIVQEALTNAMKHSGGRSVRVLVEYDVGELGIEVVDDGSPATDAGGPGAVSGSGRGLAGMRERVQLLGGSLDAGPLPGSAGFRVAARVPL